MENSNDEEFSKEIIPVNQIIEKSGNDTADILNNFRWLYVSSSSSAASVTRLSPYTVVTIQTFEKYTNWFIKLPDQ